MTEQKTGRVYGFVTVEKQSGKWKAIVGYREGFADGTSKRGRVAKVLDIAASEKNNRGKAQALKMAEQLKADLEAEEPRRLQELALAKAGKLSQNPTVSDFINYYLSKLLPAKKEIEQVTMLTYRRYEQLAANSKISSVRLTDLSAVDVGEWRDELKRKHYAPVTIKNAMGLLRSSLNEAVKLKLIEENPSLDVEAPSAKKASRKINYLEASERKRLLADLEQTLRGEMAHDEKRNQEAAYMALGIKLALLTGMREGEICALRWSDVDMDAQVINVNAAIGRKESGFYIKKPKSLNSVRAIPISAELAADLAARKVDMEKLAKLGHIKWSEQMFVLGTPERIEGGKEWSYLKPVLLWRSWHRRVVRLDLKGSTGEAPKFHDLRHTFATVAAHSGIPQTELQTIMGHSDISVTHSYYIGIDDNAQRDAMQKILAAM